MHLLKRNVNTIVINNFLRARLVHTRQKSEILPGQTKKIFRISPASKKVYGRRVNQLDIELLPSEIYQHVFQGVPEETISSEVISRCKRDLQTHGILKKKVQEPPFPSFDLKLPPLKGTTLVEHFKIIGEEQAKPYRDLILELLLNIPPKPTEWLQRVGWTRYVNGREPESIPYPTEKCVVFDVEVSVKAGKAPTLATAVSKDAWYGWVSQAVIEGSAKPTTTHQYLPESLIPLESLPVDKGINLNSKFLEPKIVIGHNVSYDRARIKEQYWLERTGTRFIDTMSLHVCVGGLSSYQRAVLKGNNDENPEDEAWKAFSSLNSLNEVNKFYCGSEIQKDTRNIFTEGTLSDVRENFQEVMNYCASDVYATYNVLKELFPMFLERFPHPVTLAGMLELSTAYLPINTNWERYIDNCNVAYEDLDNESRLILAQRADHACRLLHEDKYKEDVWMWDQDWTVKELKLRKSKIINEPEISETFEKSDKEEDEEDTLKEKFKYLENTATLLPTHPTLLPGYPNWYRKMCTNPDSTPNWVPGPTLIRTGMQITPKLLGLTWEGFPLHFIRGKGWGFLIPFEDVYTPTKVPVKQLLEKNPMFSLKPAIVKNVNINIAKEVKNRLLKKEYYSRLKKDNTHGIYKGSGIWCNEIVEKCCWFFKLPHKDGASHRVGNPLAKDFLNKFSESVLAGDTKSAENIMTIARMLSYWRNNRERIVEQMVVWLNERDLPKHLKGDNFVKYGAIVPQVVVSGTLTRRAVEATWMTASNVHNERVGSELRAMIQAPPGYNIVGADVDSQELWIASMIGDANFAKVHGATPFGWMTLSGNKSEGTDMHSVTAKAVGISRDHAKVLNYSRIYGAGQSFAEQLLTQFNPSMSENKARHKAIKMFDLTKGKRIYHLRSEYLKDLEDQPYGKWQAHKLAKMYGKTLEEMFYKPKWVGGTESAMFNQLEEIARSPEPVTPFLECRLSRALEPKVMPSDKFLPTRVNWVVQSGAVDFLHLMLVCMKWLMEDRARFCLSFHDEVRYLVPQEHKYQACLAMHVTNLLTRSFFALKLGFTDLPLSIAFFSSVEVDTVLRKDCTHNCKTPSNPHGLDKEYEIPSGESLDIYQSIEKANGQQPWWHSNETKRENVKSNKEKKSSFVKRFKTTPCQNRTS